MAKEKSKEASPPPETIPAGQKLFDNIFLWLALSFLISGVLYNVWGLIEVLGAPPLIK